MSRRRSRLLAGGPDVEQRRDPPASRPAPGCSSESPASPAQDAAPDDAQLALGLAIEEIIAADAIVSDRIVAERLQEGGDG